MVPVDMGAPSRGHSYSRASSQGGSSRMPSASGARHVPSAEPMPVPVSGSAPAVPYVDVRHRTPPPPEMLRHSPRTAAAVVPEMVDGAPMAPVADAMPPILSKLSTANEQTWLSIGSTAEAMEDYTRALSAYDSALLHNPYSVPALSAMATMYRTLDHFDLAVECFQRVLNITPDNGEVWGAMGHCYLMMDELQKAYTAYHQALYHLPNPNEPKLWYGIGILYDRYGSLEHAEETFTSVVRMDPNYEKANEIYFRLGIIYKQQGQFESSLECFRYILPNPPKPLTEMDIWFQIGHVYEQQHEYLLAKEAYERVLSENPNHAKVLQQLGGLYMQSATGFKDVDTAVHLLSQSLDSDPNDPKAWYLLGRTYMEAEEFNKAYEAYQQTVYRDGKNPVLWCSIGILYFQISQYHDALGAYSRSIRLNPYIPEIWFNLGILYESCNNQVSDAIDAYRRALELEPENPMVQQRLSLLQSAESTGKPLPPVPQPRDVHPSTYLTSVLNGSGTPRGTPGSLPDGTEGPDAPHPKDAYVAHDMDDSIDNVPKAAARPPPELASPPRHRGDEGRTSPKLPSYAATYADYRSEAGAPAYGHPGPNRYYQGAPHEWDRQYYGNSYDAPPEAAHPAPSSSRGPAWRGYDARAERAAYDAPRAGRPYTSSVRSPGLAPLAQRGHDEYAERATPEYSRDGKPADPKRTRARPESELRGARPDESVRRKREEPRAPRPAEHARKPSGSVARMSREPEPPRPAPPSRREVDEDYDEGAASALMGLAGAAASAYEASNAERMNAQREAEAHKAQKHALDAPSAEPSKRPRSEAEAPAADMSVDSVSEAPRAEPQPEPEKSEAPAPPAAASHEDASAASSAPAPSESSAPATEPTNDADSHAAPEHAEPTPPAAEAAAPPP